MDQRLHSYLHDFGFARKFPNWAWLATSGAWCMVHPKNACSELHSLWPLLEFSRYSGLTLRSSYLLWSSKMEAIFCYSRIGNSLDLRHFKPRLIRLRSLHWIGIAVGPWGDLRHSHGISNILVLLAPVPQEFVPAICRNEECQAVDLRVKRIKHWRIFNTTSSFTKILVCLIRQTQSVDLNLRFGGARSFRRKEISTLDRLWWMQCWLLLAS